MNKYLYKSKNYGFIKKLLLLTAPIAFTEIINSLISIVDVIMIVNIMSTTEITSISIANQILFLYHFSFSGIVSGCGIFIGQYYGKGEISSIKKTVGFGLTVSFVLLIAFFIPSFFIPHVLIGIFSHDPVVIDIGARYLRILSFAFLPIAITMNRNGAIRKIGETALPMKITVTSLIINVILNIFIIYIFNLPIEAIAIGTVLVRYCELLIQSYFINKKSYPIKGTIKEYLSYDFKFVKKFFKVCSYVVIGTITWSVGTSILNIAYSFSGTQAQATLQISLNTMQLFGAFGHGMSTATAIIITTTLGAGKKDLAIEYAKKCLKICITVSFIMSSIFIMLTPVFLLIFNFEEPARTYFIGLIYVQAINSLIKNLNMVSLGGILRSGGDVKFHFWLDIVCCWLISIPVVFFVAINFNFPIYFVVLSAQLAEIIKLSCAIMRISRKKWVNTLV